MTDSSTGKGGATSAHVGFGTPFQEQIDYLLQKLRVPTERWDDIQRSAHDRAFMVAGAAKADLLKDLHDAVVQRATDGKGLKAFQKDFKAIVAKHGWTGWTGEGSKEGVAWRTKVIYQTNMAQSYAAGRYRQMTDPEYVRLRPYWRYIHREGVRHPRPQHLAWHGLTLPHDHPFWQSHYPPNGWGCGCRVAPVSKAEGERSRAAGLGDPPDGWDAIDPNTGAPVGIDKGFDYAAGAGTKASLQSLIDAKLLKLPPELADALKADVASVSGNAAATATFRTWKDYASAGRTFTEALPSVTSRETAIEFHDALISLLKRDVGITEVVANTVGNGYGAEMVRNASRLYPDSWVKAANDMGVLHVKAIARRGFRGEAGKVSRNMLSIRFPEIGVVRNVKAGDGYIWVPKDSPGTAVHEYAHRIQAARPDIDALFQALHKDRTAGQSLKRLSDLEPKLGYLPGELAREDHYSNPYQGREYSHAPAAPALEVMTMGFETVIGARSTSHGSFDRPLNSLVKMYKEDREMVDFVVGLLLKHP